MAKFFIGITVIIALVFGYVAMQSPEYEVSREITISAPATKIFPYLNNAKLFETWSPWSKLDPKAEMSYSGPEEGVGAKTSWENGEKLGTGSATVIDSVPNLLVRTKLEYVKPYVMEQEALITIQQVGNDNVVIWKVKGKNNFMGRLMCLFMNMDKMVGDNFESGLSNLKQIVEAAPAQTAPATSPN